MALRGKEWFDVSVSQVSSLLGRARNLVVGRLTGDRMTRNIGWYVLADGAARVARLVATVLLARMLTPVELGVAAIAITCFELIRVVANNGVGQMVIRARPEELDATCNTARAANWIICGTCAAAHIVVGAAIAYFTGRPELFWMIACLSGVYLMMLPGLVPVYLILRRAGVREVAVVGLVQSLADSLLTAILAFMGWGAWSIILPRLITVPVWVVAVRLQQSWVRNRAAGRIPLTDMIRFALPVIGSEMLTAARINIDKILVWSILGVEALGIYFFAFNAGIGLSLSLTSALTYSLYPELAKLAGEPRRMLKRFDAALWRTALPIAGIIALQAALTFVYVPLVFGARWEHAVGLVALLCLSATTKPFFDAAGQLLRAGGLPMYEMAASTLFTCVTLVIFAASLTQGLANGVMMLALFTLILQVSFALWSRRMVASQPHDAASAFAIPSVPSAHGLKP